MFFSFDGVDGAGKSTQMGLFCDWLRESGHDVVACRDPGSTRLGEAIRAILLEHSDTPIHRRSEMLLYMAARAQLVEELVRPQLAAGRTVVSDRFLLANVVYQGHAGGLDIASVWQVGGVATSGICPDRTFVLDLDVATATRRIRRAHDRMEAQGPDFQQRVRQGFLSEASQNPERISVIDASRDVAAVQADIREAARPHLAESSIPQPRSPFPEIP